MEYAREKLKWNGWGWADTDFDFQDREAAFWEYFGEVLGIEEFPDTPTLALEAIELPSCRLSSARLKQLREVIDADRVRVDRFERIFHAVGRSYRDMVLLRSGELPSIPDVVVYPRNEEELTGLLALADKAKAALIPFGGGSSVVGGVEAAAGESYKAVITVDFSQMNHILDIDVDALTARVQPGIYGPQLEAQLHAEGFTLGHYPQSFEFSTLGGWVAARGAGQQSNRYGAAAKFLVGARVLSPKGVLETKNFPNSSAGPDLKHLIAGSEGTLGFITEVSVRLHHLPATRDYRAYLFPNFIAGAAALRELVQEHTDVAMLRLSDESETHFYTKVHGLGKPKNWMKQFAKQAMAAAGVPQRPCVLMVGLEGPRRKVAGTRIKVTQTCFRHRGIPAGTGPGKGWYETRFQTPYLRDHLMDRGIGIDTLETATSWSNLHNLHQAVCSALSEALKAAGLSKEPIVLAHISHSYQTGASLYFTYIFPMKVGAELEQWLAIKRAASNAIRDNGGTISHHHGVGVDHREWIEPEKGPLGVEVLRATKKVLDPKGLMNPGKLIP